MHDSRINKLVKNIIEYSIELKKGEKVMISTFTYDTSLTECLIKEIYKIGAVPFVVLRDERVLRELLKESSVEQWQLLAKVDAVLMKEMDAFIGVRFPDNATELEDIPFEKQQIYSREYVKPVHFDIRVPDTKWVVLRWPTPSFAQSAGMSTEAFEDLFFNVCNLDYTKMAKAMEPLVELMERTDKVRIIGKGTDLTFSIADIPVHKCAGERNLPDGEVFTAPVKNSVNGILTYNAKTNYEGTIFDGIKLEFKDGKIVKAESGAMTEHLNSILDTDEGARYVGEFALGVNPYITSPVLDTLFDEKIMGSFHFTPGASYEDADNTNRSAIHWDMVCIQTEEYGGGEIYFDGTLIRKNGVFMLSQLEGLNPENLK